MKIIIQKFGGTSVSTNERRDRAVKHIVAAKEKGLAPVVVVSAIGRKGDPYATDTLLDLVSGYGIDIPNRELDLLMSCGEIISCIALVAHLKRAGYKAKSFTGAQAGIKTDDDYGDARVLKVEPDNIIKDIKEGIIPIVAGFQGVTLDNEITTLGRGGSDTTAVVLGEALSALSIEIYTDVDGIMTADPRIVPTAAILRHISYSDMFQIAEQGAKVIHPRAIEMAMRSNIPVIIRNTMKDSEGTIISSSPMADVWNRAMDISDAITSITHIPNRIQIHVEDIALAAQNKLLSEFARGSISIDLINIFPNKLMFTIDDYNRSKAKDILGKCKYSHSLIEDCSKVSVIGNKMRGMPGIMASIIRALVSKNIEILQTADSHTTISCLVHEEDTIDAVLALHEEFKLSKR